MAKGFLLTPGEWKPEVLEVASAIAVNYNEMLCALSISGPANRILQAVEEVYIGFVLAVRDGLFKNLGFVKILLKG